MAKKAIINTMARFQRKPAKEKGLAPGTLVFVGSQRMDKPLVRIIDYNEEKLTEKEISDVNEVLEFKDTNTVTWLNIDGIHEADLIEKAGVIFNLSSIVLADIMHTRLRPRIAVYDNCIFLVLHMLRFNKEGGGNYLRATVHCYW